jgi:hypothetical protein
MKFGRGQTLVNSPTAGMFYVKWKNATLPNGVRVGEYITLTGKIITLDLGRAFLVISAELLRPATLKEIKKFIEEKKHETSRSALNPGEVR